MKVKQIGTPATVRHGEPLTLFNAAIIINNVYQQNLEPTQAGYIPKRIANKIRTQLHGYEILSSDGIDSRLELLLVVMRELRIIVASKQPLRDNKIVYEPGPTISSWGNMDQAGQIRELLISWAEGSWPSSAGVNFVPTSNFMYTISPNAARIFLLTYLADTLDIDVWYDLNSILDNLREQQPTIMRPQYSYSTKKQRTDFMNNREEWMRTEGELYIGMFNWTLFEMGLVDLGYREQDFVVPAKHSPGINPSAIRLTELAWNVLQDFRKEAIEAKKAKKITMISSEPAVVAPKGDRPLPKFILQPNFDLLLLEPDLASLYSMLPIAQIKQIGHSSTLQLTQNLILRGMRTGLKTQDIIDLLQTRCQNTIPQNVLYTIKDWAKLYREATIETALLITVPEEIGSSLVQLEKLQPFNARLLAPGLLAIDADSDLNKVIAILEKEKLTTRVRSQFQFDDDDEDEDDEDYDYYDRSSFYR